jgi:hypothetical protein
VNGLALVALKYVLKAATLAGSSSTEVPLARLRHWRPTILHPISIGCLQEACCGV